MIPSQRGAVRRALSSYSAPTRLRRRRKDANAFLSPPPLRHSRRARFAPSFSDRRLSRTLSHAPAASQPPSVLFPLADALPRTLTTTDDAVVAVVSPMLFIV